MFTFKFKIITILLIIFILLSLSYNRFVLPVIIEASEKYAVTLINKEISSAYSDIITKYNINQQDFTSGFDEKSMQYINTNTVIVNKLCAEMAEQISLRLNNIRDEKIKVPIGLFTSNNLLSRIGPRLNMSIDSMGDARVDYDSSFEACGVNQVNYKLWLEAECEAAVITPAVNKNLIIKRKIMIIDMVYNGGVPNAYVDIKK